MNAKVETRTTLAEGKRFAIERFELTSEQVEEAKFAALCAMSLHDHYDMKPGVYTRLVDKELNEVVMSDTSMERRTNTEIIERAYGHVLIAGLGIGMILKPILASRKVHTVTVVEKYAEVIDLNMLAGFDINHPKLTLVTADILEWNPGPLPRDWNVIYFDIWNSIGSENRPEMDELHKRFESRLAPGGWMESWRRGDCQDEISPEVKEFYRALIKRNPLAAAIMLAGSAAPRKRK